ncbi:MAG: hypothetical protein UW81_C0020G0015 [Candidatus Giovannonibacteria bacterium GW2011_GWC2_44_9]|uniref:TrpR like protein, YerC/YecD n=3 Tax=Candidatus Giovannoniibacteriota TaxID=1752738 RepID=A0A0G1IUC0_9BACT|nr:MAG: hypothetical protein UW49_C0013G0013 [Candidatus Giovannonibacteria bacterium GW2011_GWB1_44_23]KKT62956.1 MAG: hypothetical protein UW57_C0011G0013 [Candidatus Giovannonibacteria bacterium GW2011_GWA1_44_29]KKT83363.1 MAG: hypothetical protein UW81_C0020G0015 [Candidatus Giovannonibacteria bacterium GW2011_GWC2_44_9]KKT91481.1 MAG: hypothetical protein UW93_C0006G0032 [Parcubacteria group bacterium GW2011_GWC1_45_13]
MPHVSRKKLKKKVFIKIGEKLSDTVAKANSAREVRWIFKELITPTECVMLAKRLAIILMLEKGHSFNTIQRTLKVTPQTIVRFWKITKQSLHKSVIKEISASKTKGDFWQELEKLILLGMSPRGR